MDPLCLRPFNEARECLFQADGGSYPCKQYMNLYVQCQKDPQEFKKFLELATPEQKREKKFDFSFYRGHFNNWS